MLLLSWPTVAALLLWSTTVLFRPSVGCRSGPKGDTGPQGIRGDPGLQGERGPPGPHTEAEVLLDMERRLVHMELMVERVREGGESRERKSGERFESVEALASDQEEKINKQNESLHRHDRRLDEIRAGLGELGRAGDERWERVERLSAEVETHRDNTTREARLLRERIAQQTKRGADLEEDLRETARDCRRLAQEASSRFDHLTAGIGQLNETLARVALAVAEQAENDHLRRQELERQAARIQVQEDSLAGAVRERQGLEERLRQQADVIEDQDTKLKEQSVAVEDLSARLDRYEQLTKKLQDSIDSKSVAISDLITQVNQNLEGVRRLAEEIEQRKKKDVEQDNWMGASDLLTSGIEAQIEKLESTLSTLLFNLDFHEDCSAIKLANPDSNDGVYDIYSLNNGSLDSAEVWCDMTTEGGGWTILQRRFDGSLDFNRNFSEYVTGFGSAEGELWLGLKWQHLLTTNKPVELRIDLEERDGKYYYAKYNKFTIGEGDLYRLNFDEYSGSAGDGLQIDQPWHQGQGFSAMGRDLTDNYDCPRRFKGGWWFGICFFSNLNGGDYHSDEYRDGMFWWSTNNQQSLAKSKMMIRAK